MITLILRFYVYMWVAYVQKLTVRFLLKDFRTDCI